MAKNKISSYDASEYLATEEDMAAYLEAALEDGNTALIVQALGNLAKARGMTQIAKESGRRHESLYKAFSAEGYPEFAAVLKVSRDLALRLSVTSSQQ